MTLTKLQGVLWYFDAIAPEPVTTASNNFCPTQGQHQQLRAPHKYTNDCAPSMACSCRHACIVRARRSKKDHFSLTSLPSIWASNLSPRTFCICIRAPTKVTPYTLVITVCFTTCSKSTASGQAEGQRGVDQSTLTHNSANFLSLVSTHYEYRAPHSTQQSGARG